ncbi:hypothetical protein [Burkholderia sp. BCC0398]|uniref:hypothetical protein n=1 Tax=Burkholderia sp. BCC0398 TaxID=2676297 RepID=UPI001589F2F6|nr:hypothetical protein [Burkholderia sp. BCC0398]
MTTTPLTDKLRKAKEQWEAQLPVIPEQVPGQNGVQIPKNNITEWLDFIIAGVERAELSHLDPGIKSIYWQNIVNSVTNVENHMNSAQTNGQMWVQQTTNTLQSYLWTIRAALPWLLPITPDMLAGDRVAALTELATRSDQVIETASRASEAEGRLTTVRSKIDTIFLEIESINEKILGYERASATATTNASASATNAEAEKQKVDAYVIELDIAAVKQRELFDLFDKKREEIEHTLEGASRVALAQSFETRRKVLQRLQYFWAAIFSIGIIALTVTGIILWNAVLEQASTTTIAGTVASITGASAVAPRSSTPNFYLLSLLRFVVLTPGIWLTWFAARQYGQCQRLGEDYAFKSAAAHAFVGYRNEMNDDDEMIKLLREYAVKNFGANPIRVLSKNDAASPLHDIFDRLLDKVSPDKLIDIIKDYIEKPKS